jgi:hypothetical protein
MHTNFFSILDKFFGTSFLSLINFVVSLTCAFEHYWVSYKL